MFRNATKLLVASALTFGVAGCDVDQTREGAMPEVDVQGGQLPEYDVDPADVDIGTRTDTVEVPNIDVNTEERQVEVPTFDIDTHDDAQE